MSTTINLQQSIYALALNRPNSYKFIYDVAMGYNVWSTILAGWNDASKIAPEDGIYLTADNKYTFTTKDTDWVVETITGNLLVGTNLQISYAGTNDFFRLKQTLTDDSNGGVRGQVIAHGPGTVTIAPVNIAFVAATMFTAGMPVKEFSYSGAFRASSGTETIYKLPTPDYDYAQNFRATCSLAASDGSWTYPEFEGKPLGYAQIHEAIRQTQIEKERQYLLGGRASYVSPIEGQTYETASLKWAAQNRGGQYIPATSAPTFAQFNNILLNQQIKRAGNGGNGEVLILTGTGFLSYFQQNFVPQFVQTAGINNTIGGVDVKGLSAMQYSILGRNYKFVVLPILDDPNWAGTQTTIPGFTGGRLSNSFFIVDTQVLKQYGGSGSRPPIQEIYWGQRGVNMKVISGMIGSNLTADNGQNSQNGFQNTSSSVDAMQVEVMDKAGQHIPSAKGITFFEVLA